MRHRILRHVGQRTELLAAVSHDLRTPLTRMRLELELLGADGDDPVLAGPAQRRRRDGEAGRELSGLRPRRGPGGGRAHRPEADPRQHARARRAQRCRARDQDGAAADPAAPPAGLPPLPRQPRRQCLPLRRLDRDQRSSAATSSSRSQVEDDGPGIPEAYREKVFQPFFRLDAAPTARMPAPASASPSPATWCWAMAATCKLERSSRGGLRALMLLPA